MAIAAGGGAGAFTGWLLALLGRRELQRLYRGRDRRLPSVWWSASPAAGLVAGVSAGFAGLDVDAVVGVAGVAAALGLAAAADLRRRLIPNVAVLAIAFQGLYDAAVYGRLSEAAIAAALSAGILLVPFAIGRGRGGVGRGGIGWGDVKLAAAIGAWLGPLAPMAIVAGSAIGMLWWAVRSFQRGFRLSWRIPYGTALAGGVALVVGWRLVSFAG